MAKYQVMEIGIKLIFYIVYEYLCYRIGISAWFYMIRKREFIE